MRRLVLIDQFIKTASFEVKVWAVDAILKKGWGWERAFRTAVDYANRPTALPPHPLPGSPQPLGAVASSRPITRSQHRRLPRQPWTVPPGRTQTRTVDIGELQSIEDLPALVARAHEQLDAGADEVSIDITSFVSRTS